MKRINVVLIFMFCVTLFLTSFIFGYRIMKYNYDRKKPIVVGDNYDDTIGLEIIKEDERISPNTFIERKTHYKTCNHNIIKLENADEKIINMTEEEFNNYIEENFPNVKIISFSIDEIKLEEERNHLCPNHYIIGVSNGKIAIYSIDENGERVLNKVFEDYPISLLKKIDQDKLIEGIVVDSEEELSNVLENFIS
ncbi:MAG: hypothetical protein GXY88_05675 [Tissierellia bacterium]|nr:hypothetical protein [Tissierellia bacterium]